MFSTVFGLVHLLDIISQQSDKISAKTAESSRVNKLYVVWSFWSVGLKCPSPFDKTVVPSTALLYPAYKNNNMLGLGLCNRNVLSFHWACEINEISNWNFCWRELSTPGLPFSTLSINIHPGINATCNENMVNKNRQKVILTVQPIFLGEGVAAHLGHQVCSLPLHDVASHVRVKQTVTQLNIVPFWKSFITRKMSTIFK